MGALKDFEIKALSLLAKGVMSERQIAQLSDEGEVVSIDFSGAGYLVTLRHSSIDQNRMVLDHVIVSGTLGELTTGFIAFVENGEATLECFSYGGETVPPNFRELQVLVTC